MSELSKAIDAALTERGHGSINELAYFCGVTRYSVKRWREGSAKPLYIRWDDIETFLRMPRGTIEALSSQE